jgi:hypothetical protein
MCSRYHKWFVDLGYPQLDINEYPDGEWEIIEYLNAPIIPSLTRWNAILSGIRHVEPSFSFCRNYVRLLDTRQRYYWDMEELKSREAEMAAEDMERHAEDLVERASYAVAHNPWLMERIAQNGLSELRLSKIAKHIPRSAGAL